MIQLIGSLIPVLLFVCFTKGPALLAQHHMLLAFTQTFTLRDLVFILFLGIINTGVGCYLYFSAIEQLPLATVSIVGYLEPLSAVVFSVLLMNEQMTFIKLTGALLIIFGAGCSELMKPGLTSLTRQG